jgi:hypothetical protein
LERDVRQLLQQAPIAADQQEPLISKSIRSVSKLSLDNDDSTADSSDEDEDAKGQRRRQNTQKFRALRAVATVKRRIAALHNPLQQHQHSPLSADDDIRP